MDSAAAVVVGFGVFFPDSGPVSLDRLKELAMESSSLELKVIRVESGHILGRNYLAANEHVPMDYMIRSAGRLRRDLELAGVEVTDSNFHVVIHNLWAKCHL